MNVVERLQEVDVLDADGHAVRLGSLWQSQTVVLVFVRHYG